MIIVHIDISTGSILNWGKPTVESFEWVVSAVTCGLKGHGCGRLQSDCQPVKCYNTPLFHFMNGERKMKHGLFG
jgi:hypothetical protein